VALALNVAEALPDAFVTTVMAAAPLLNVPEAPDAGAVNVTLTPGSGFRNASLTMTANGLGKAVLAAAD
jgi:hypothetical protein